MLFEFGSPLEQFSLLLLTAEVAFPFELIRLSIGILMHVEKHRSDGVV